MWSNDRRIALPVAAPRGEPLFCCPPALPLPLPRMMLRRTGVAIAAFIGCIPTITRSFFNGLSVVYGMIDTLSYRVRCVRFQVPQGAIGIDPIVWSGRA